MPRGEEERAPSEYGQNQLTPPLFFLSRYFLRANKLHTCALSLDGRDEHYRVFIWLDLTQIFSARRDEIRHRKIRKEKKARAGSELLKTCRIQNYEQNATLLYRGKLR
jgi:hypothetical protein